MPTDQNPYEHESEVSSSTTPTSRNRGCLVLFVIVVLGLMVLIIALGVLFGNARHAAAEERWEAIKRQQLEQRQREEQIPAQGQPTSR